MFIFKINSLQREKKKKIFQFIQASMLKTTILKRHEYFLENKNYGIIRHQKMSILVMIIIITPKIKTLTIWCLEDSL